MSAAHSILAEITRRGIAVRVDGETLRFKPRLALDDDLVERIKEHKAEIIRAVVTEGSDQVFDWSPESLAAERRFGQSHAKLFPFLGRKVRTPKGFTHTSLLFEVGASPTVAQAQLRHSDARITLGVYGHVIGDSQRNAVERVAQILRPDAPKLETSGESIQ